MCVYFVFRDKKNSVENYFRKKNTTPCTPQEAAILTESVLSMICKDMRLISAVEGEGFKEMLTTFEAGYTLPSRRHFTTLIEKKYETSVEKLKKTLKWPHPKSPLALMPGPVW